MEEKINKLASLIVNYSIDVQKDEKVLLQVYGEVPKMFVKSLIKEINSVGAVASINQSFNDISTLCLESNSEKLYEVSLANLKNIVDIYDSFILIRNDDNIYETKYIDSVKLKKLGNNNMKYNSIKINDRKWVLLDYPNQKDANKMGMGYDEFFNYSMDAMCTDYEKMKTDVEPLVNLMNKTDKVRITGPNTNISFSIKDINTVSCTGDKNLPDGEVYTAPVLNSVNGTITYNVPSNNRGITFNNVSLTFENGKIVDCKADNNIDELNKIFDTDEGARYVGEFAIGINKMVTKPTNNILYDEKINGSIHFTPGKCYDDASNGNKSSIHWDLVLIQTEEYGGGEIYFDDVLVRKDGIFVIDELKHLN